MVQASFLGVSSAEAARAAGSGMRRACDLQAVLLLAGCSLVLAALACPFHHQMLPLLALRLHPRGCSSVLGLQ